VIVIVLLPGLSYCQSKSDKYPKQTVINEDTVVILSLRQALEMNESFLQLQAELDSINSIVDTLTSVVVLKQNENITLHTNFNIVNKQLNGKYFKQHKLEIARDITVGVGLITTFFFVTNFFHEQ
jgi:hypothetical protein